MLRTIKNGQTAVILRAKLLDSTQTRPKGLTGLTSASSGLNISTICDNEATATTYTVAGSTIETISTLGTYAAPTATKCRFKEVDATNHKGLYEFQFADARFAVAGAKSMIVSVSGATNLDEANFLVQLQSDDPYVAKPTNSNLLSIDGNGRVDVTKIAGMAQTARDIGASVLLSNGTGTGQVQVSGGVVRANDSSNAGLATAADQATILSALGTIAGYIDTEMGTVVTAVGAIKTKTDFLPSATAGAAGGVLIAGANAPTSFASLAVIGLVDFQDGMQIIAATTDRIGLKVAGNGSAAAAQFAGGPTGNGIEMSGYNAGLSIEGEASGLVLYSSDGIALNVLSDGTFAAQFTGATGGMVIGSASGVSLTVDSIQISGLVDLQGAMQVAGGIAADITGNVNGTVSTVTTLTGHTPQTGDSYPIVSDGASGNAALKTLIDAKASQSSVDDLPTNAELAIALAGADDATLSALSALISYGDAHWSTATGFSTHTPGDVTEHLLTTLIASDTTVQDALLAAGTGGGSGSDSPGVTTLLVRLSADRAGYLDNLSAGAVAQEDTLTAMKGAGFDSSTDSLEALRNRGDAAWITATGFASQASVDDVPTNTALLSALGAVVSSISAHGDVAWSTATGFAVAGDAMTLTSGERTATTAAMGLRQITEGYRPNGEAPTFDQAISEVLAHMGESENVGTRKKLRGFDHTTVAMEFDYDDATNPTSIRRAA